MKQKFIKSTKFRLLICLLFLITAFIIHSCKKDGTNQSTADITDPAVSQAKQWYESTYPVTATLNSKQATQSVNQIGNVPFDYTQHLKPDWQHAATYNRLGAAVVEIPLDPSSDKVGSDFKDLTNNKVIYKQQYSRSTFLLLNYGAGYNAYIMTIVADSTYLKGNLSKLANNTYRKHDADFSGVVMYSTPKGAFVSSFGYYNGKLLPPLSQNSTSGTQAVQSLSTPALKPTDAAAPSCVAWYLDTYVNGELISSDYLFTTCAQSSGGGGGGGENGGGAGTSPTPAPCIPPQSTGTDAVTGHLVIDAPIGSEPPPTDGGNPAPVNYCPTATITVTDTTVNPCAQKVAISTMAANAVIANQNAQILSYTNSSGNEYGVNQNLSSTTGNNYINSVPTTNGANTTWNVTFSWDSTNGYTVGFSHGHPNDSGPSPNDVANIVYPIGNTTLKNASIIGSQTAVQFYESKAAVTTITNSGTYVVTINNWANVVNTIGSSFSTQQQQNAFNTNYSNLASKYISFNQTEDTGSAGAYALMSLFGNSINVYFAPTGSTTFNPITLGSNYTITQSPCP